MKGAENKLILLTRLLETGSVARSACGREFLATLKPLLDSQIIVEDRAGAGRRLVVHDHQALRQFILHHFPNAPVPAGASSRVVGVSHFRNTKSLSSDLPEIVTVRAWQDDLLQTKGNPIATAEATRLHGVFAFLLQDAARHTLHGPCAGNDRQRSLCSTCWRRCGNR